MSNCFLCGADGCDFGMFGPVDDVVAYKVGLLPSSEVLALFVPACLDCMQHINDQANQGGEVMRAALAQLNSRIAEAINQHGGLLKGMEVLRGSGIRARTVMRGE